jgi:Pyruvate dehydrogenase complex, dehydrogenase (E1) component
MASKPDIDPQETQEWLESLDAVLEHEGTERAHYLLERLIDSASLRAYLPFSATRPMSHHPVQSRTLSGIGPWSVDSSFVRWNAMAWCAANRLSTSWAAYFVLRLQRHLYDVADHFFAPPHDLRDLCSSRHSRRHLCRASRSASARSSSTLRQR